MSADQPNYIELDELAASVLSSQVIEQIDEVEIKVKVKVLRAFLAKRLHTRILYSTGRLYIDLHVVLTGKQIIMLLSAVGVTGFAMEIAKRMFGF